MFFNLHVLSKSPAEMSPPIGVILELRSHANLPFRKLALKILIEFVLNLNWWFHEETAHWTNRLFSIEKKKLFRFWKKFTHKKIPISQSCSTLCQSDWRNWSQLAREPNSLQVLTKQANDSWHACFASWAPPPHHGFKRRARTDAHQLFASEPSLSAQISESVYRLL